VNALLIEHRPDAGFKSATGVSVEIQNKRANDRLAPLAGNSILACCQPEGQYISLAFVEQEAF
jgi:hypothetical protein